MRLVQGYLNTDKARTVRVRLAGDRAFLTIKGKSEGISRAEYEYEIPHADASELLNLCDSVIDKCRYTLEVLGLVWEVDEFFGANEGLVVAEVELKSETHSITLPDWVGEEVSGDWRYFNSSLIQNPYCTWGNSKA